jgi:hypothetical protein
LVAGSYGNVGFSGPIERVYLVLNKWDQQESPDFTGDFCWGKFFDSVLALLLHERRCRAVLIAARRHNRGND